MVVKSVLRIRVPRTPECWFLPYHSQKGTVFLGSTDFVRWEYCFMKQYSHFGSPGVLVVPSGLLFLMHGSTLFDMVFPLTIRFFCRWFSHYLNEKSILFIYSFCLLIIFTSSTEIAKKADRSRCFDRSATIQSPTKKIVGTLL